jgi:hypothetical protein
MAVIANQAVASDKSMLMVSREIEKYVSITTDVVQLLNC